MGDLEDLQGRSYGPVRLDASPQRVADFVVATRGVLARWGEYAPPMLANAALFTAAPQFLADPVVVPHTRSLIHSTQSYAWSRSLRVGEALQVSGRVAAVRARGSLHFVTFELDATGDDGPWLTGSSLFLLSAEAAAESADQPEPPATVGPAFGGLTPTTGLPESGESLPPYQCGASRLDLVRYAAATGDWNPIHWDHDSARAAGLPGTIVHGLLMAAWMADAVIRFTSDPDPVRTLEVRFRSPLRPAVSAVVEGTMGSDPGVCDLSLSAGGERLVTGRIQVTQ